jgi:hypothetical protein
MESTHLELYYPARSAGRDQHRAAPEQCSQKLRAMEGTQRWRDKCCLHAAPTSTTPTCSGGAGHPTMLCCRCT